MKGAPQEQATPGSGRGSPGAGGAPPSPPGQDPARSSWQRRETVKQGGKRELGWSPASLHPPRQWAARLQTSVCSAPLQCWGRQRSNRWTGEGEGWEEERRDGGRLKRQSRAKGSWLAGGSCSTGLRGCRQQSPSALLSPAQDSSCLHSEASSQHTPDCRNTPKPFAQSHHQALQGVSTKRHLSYLQISAVPSKHMPSQTPTPGTHCRIW